MRRKLRALVIRLFPDRALFQLRRVLFKLKWREPELALVQVLARPEKAFLDVGAHKGVYCLAALGHYREIIGVEPFPPMARYLQAGLAGKARIMHMALSNRQARVCGLWAYIVPCYSVKQRQESRSMWACRCRCGHTIADS